MKQPYKVKYIKMTEEEQRAWVHQWAVLAIDSFIEKYGYLPRPPSEREYKRLLAEIKKEEQGS